MKNRSRAYLSVDGGKLVMESLTDHGHVFKEIFCLSDTTEVVVKSLVESFDEHNIVYYVCSSSVDFPEEYGSRLNSEELGSVLDEAWDLWSKIDNPENY